MDQADAANQAPGATGKAHSLPGQAVLVFQGGGALGAYQGGVYQALHEAGIEPDWVIGTSIGAINAALIAGNVVESRLHKLEEFWRRIEHGDLLSLIARAPSFGPSLANWATLTSGLASFFRPNLMAFLSPYARL